ncbi:MAG: hypothetical protein HN576_13085 [Bacteriovoracaceae bacterium]|jgi:hypothetical protein|nr:hypothetical protein [Bacteriovoracaceae bacterium]|tara:strand:- start:276 stop:536 length:261 start_codon:yes stop_codon:yes gene_type:complete
MIDDVDIFDVINEEPFVEKSKSKNLSKLEQRLLRQVVSEEVKKRRLEERGLLKAKKEELRKRYLNGEFSKSTNQNFMRTYDKKKIT